MKIKYVNYGLANNYGDVIEINRNLIYYPKLFNPILKHELEHTDEFFTKHDLIHDFSSSYNINQKDLIKFMVKHPKSFTQLLPLYYSKSKGFVYDINLSIFYVMFISFVSSAIYIGVHL